MTIFLVILKLIAEVAPAATAEQQAAENGVGG